jgi:hypothetical protein
MPHANRRQELAPRAPLGVEKAYARASVCSKLCRHAFDLIEIPRRHFRRRGTKRENILDPGIALGLEPRGTVGLRGTSNSLTPRKSCGQPTRKGKFSNGRLRQRLQTRPSLRPEQRDPQVQCKPDG